MTYVIGGSNGNKEKYLKMLKNLSPADTDAVFILGDMLGSGGDGIEILKDMMYRGNVFPVLGEQEYMAKELFPLICSAKNIEEAKSLLSGEKARLFEKWLTMKSEKTITDFLSLDEENKESIMDYLTEFTPYEEVEAGGKTFILVYAGIDGFEEGKPLDEYDEESFIFAETDYQKEYFTDSFLITGHTLTAHIDKKYANKVYAKKRHLALNCGVAFGGKLASVCLEKRTINYC